MRKPIHLEARGALLPRERAWAAIRALKKFTLSELSRRAKVHHATLRTYVKALENAGFIKPQEGSVTGKRGAAAPEMRYELVKDIGIEAPRLKNDGTPSTQGIGREQLWRTMKIIRQFTTRELAVQASTDEHQVKENEARGYIQHLAKAGYVHMIKSADQRAVTQAVYLFVRSKNTGPKPPMIQGNKQVYDQNLGKIVYTPPAREVAK
jgi:hypothetical protein